MTETPKRGYPIEIDDSLDPSKFLLVISDHSGGCQSVTLNWGRETNKEELFDAMREAVRNAKQPIVKATRIMRIKLTDWIEQDSTQ